MKAENKFEIESNLFVNLFDAMPFKVYVADVNSFELVFVNRRLNDSVDVGEKKKCFEAIYKKDSPCEHCQRNKLINLKGQSNGDTIVTELFNDIDDRWYQLQEKCVGWPDGKVVKYTIGVDITEQKQTQNELAEAHAKLAIKNKQLELLSTTDALTKLNNRLKLDSLLLTELDRTSRYERQFSVILLDIDHFKSVNDTYGHLVGDKVLQGVAQVLSRHSRRNDHVGRWGGEEFLLICPETQLGDACIAAEKLREAIEQTEFLEAGKVTCSFGVAEHSNFESIDELIARVDNTLYLAKDRGRNCVVSVRS